MRTEKVVFATHFAPALDLYNRSSTASPGSRSRAGTSWPGNDRTVHPELQRIAAKRMGATIYETDSSHARMLSQRSVVLDVIRAAATVIQGFAVGVA